MSRKRAQRRKRHEHRSNYRPDHHQWPELIVRAGIAAAMRILEPWIQWFVDPHGWDL